jgi:hypothetical protein
MRRILAVVLAVVAGVLVFAAPASAATVTVDCRHLPGTGEYANPLRVGTVTRPVVIMNCPPLSAGKGLAVRYFSFVLTAGASASGVAMTYYLPGGPGLSGVHPRLVRPPYTLKKSSAAFYTSGAGLEGFYQPIGDIGAGGFLLGAEKLSSPLGSLPTVWFNVLIKP